MTQKIICTGFSRIATISGFLLALSAPVMAAPGQGEKSGESCHPMRMSRLSVSGQGEARVAPDLATIQLGVETRADKASDAMEQNSTQQKAVIDALKEAGIETKDIQTSGLNLNPMVNYGEDQKAEILGYQASNTVSVRVAEVSELGNVLDAVVAAGANNIHGISFQREDSQAVEDEARRAAVEDARHKAEVMAEAAGMTLGPVLVIRDAQSQSGPQPMMMRAADAKSSATPVEAGELSVTADVHIDFALRGEDAACGDQRDQLADDNAAPAPEQDKN